MASNSYYPLLRSLMPLSEKHRALLGSLLGLRRFEWTVSEFVRGGLAITCKLRSEESDAATGHAIVEYGSVALPETQVHVAGPLAARILPYPFSLLPKESQGLFQINARVEGPAAKFTEDLLESIALIEQMAYSVEFLWIRLFHSVGHADLLVHSVRRDILRVGLLDGSAPIVSDLSSAMGKESTRLDELVGTRTAYLPLELDKPLENQIVLATPPVLGCGAVRGDPLVIPV